MKKFTIFLLGCLGFLSIARAQTVIPIVSARSQPVGSSVTIRGILLNDASKMGWTYYIQDETGGIAGYDQKFSVAGVKPGDILVVTGTLKNYNSLLEISPVTTVTIESSNNPLPDPVALSIPAIITGTGGEDYEAMLVKLTSVHFKTSDQGTLFSAGTSGKNYDVTDNYGNTMQVRILPYTDINNTLIPFGNVNITGCLGQYSPSNPIAGYQLVPRSLEDIVSNQSIQLTAPVAVTDITNSSVTIQWVTDNPGSTLVKYGNTPALEKGILTGANNTTEHTITMNGGPSELFYARVYSVSASVATDTARSSIGVYITASNSTGSVKTYFNTPVDNSVSTGTNAIYLDKSIDDTLVAYIGRAKQTIDVAIYSLNNEGLSNISQALNAAATRGVNVRLIYCGTAANAGVVDLNSGVKKLQGPGENNTTYPTRYGIMHNKFMIIDAGSANANDPLVWTGSFNWTDNNMNKDANNAIIIQDQSLAKVYQLEFEEMWGTKTLTPDATKAKFGNAKTDNTPHMLKIGGNWIESYFSPSDNVNATIVNKIRTSETSLETALMLITRKEMAYAISDVAKAGSVTKVLVNSKEECAPVSGDPPVADMAVVNALSAACGENFRDYNGGGVMHNKYLIIDEANTASDPMLITGSHNWSASANNYNDENTIVIHDAGIANVYHQNFVKIFDAAETIYGIDNPQGFSDGDVLVFPNPVHDILYINLRAERVSSYTLSLLDLSGRVLQSMKSLAFPGQNQAKIDVSGLSQGIYIVRVSAEAGNYSQKIVVK